MNRRHSYVQLVKKVSFEENYSFGVKLQEMLLQFYLLHQNTEKKTKTEYQGILTAKKLL